MPMPKSVVKIKKDGVEYVSNVDRAQYTIQELTKAALRDTAKLLRNRIKKAIPVHTGTLRKNMGTWVRRRKDGSSYLQVGIYDRQRAKKKGYPYAYHAHLLEFGTVKMKPQPFLKPTVYENISMIRQIQGSYLSAIENENKAMGLIEEGEEIADD